ncbi:hypothetical protein RhiirA5_432171 [Rhizophagus irregularis]|uniref:Uncharacterized protein n=1 Tax=Rhizophagus irregularis TaxID=588596 RepID=A0A2N0NTT2_9GLOM|nr:hypothetical protein RhiirA5_432171 [Rhizophagus irregularis]
MKIVLLLVGTALFTLRWSSGIFLICLRTYRILPTSSLDTQHVDLVDTGIFL